MSGAVAAHASYNGSGTQGLAVTNKISANDSDVMSLFWNKNDTTKQLLYGSSIMEIPTSGVSGTTSWGGNQIFTVNNDIDALGDLYIQLGIKVEESVPAAIASMDNIHGGAVTVRNFGLASIIERVEFQVGTQIWQTLEHDDILACNCTELGESAFKKFGQASNGFLNPNGVLMDSDSLVAAAYPPLSSNVDGNSASVPTTNPIPYISQSQSSKHEIWGASETGLSRGSRVNTGNGMISFGYRPEASMFLRLPLLTKTMAPELQAFTDNCENGYLMAAAPHQSVKIKIYFTDDLTKVFTDKTGTGMPTTSQVSIQPGKLFGRCMIMCNEEREQMKSQPAGIPKRLKMTQNVNKSQTLGLDANYSLDLDHFSLYSSHLVIVVTGDPGCGLDTAELKLNSSSFSGTIDGQLLDGITASSMGLVSNALDNPVDNNVRDSDMSNKALYVFPLASRAYGGSSVPLNRFDNIRLVLNFSKDAIVRTVNVTCVGETTSLFKGGAASLAMY
jgi:hypothetical protein